MQGTTPQSFIITPAAFDTTRPGRYSGVITVTTEAPAETQNPTQPIALSLDVFAPELGGLPADVNLVYSIPDQTFMLDAYTLTPANVGSAAALDWQVATDSPWLHIEPHSGQTPQPLTLTATQFDTLTVATYTGVITLTATSGAPVYRSPQILPVTLQVIDRPIERVYLPTLMR